MTPSIQINSARVNNLKNISLSIPRNTLTVITGVSGSGKSSLAYDTIYAEGQRRYVESLSAYARQFLGRIQKPEVDSIKGIPPAIAIEQKTNTRNPRSTVGTSTEIYDYLKLLFARVGKTYSPISGQLVQRDSVADIIKYILTFSAASSAIVMAPLSKTQKLEFSSYYPDLLTRGTTRVEFNSEIIRLEDTPQKLKSTDNLNIIIDRIPISDDPDTLARYADSIQTALADSGGYCIVRSFENDLRREFSDKFECDGIHFEEPSEHLFSFNSPYGACPTCEGYGTTIGISEDLVIPNKNLSVYQDAVAPWRSSFAKWRDAFMRRAVASYDFPIHRAYKELSDEEKNLLWNGSVTVDGINNFFQYLDENKHKIQYRVLSARYQGKTICPNCRGSRLRKEASYVKVAGKTLPELVLLPIDQLFDWINTIELDAHDQQVASRLLTEIRNRLSYLLKVGLPYLSLNRLSNTLSGGESQRINLATSLGSALVGSLYILDEPSIGLHPRDTAKLISVLRDLQKLGNTVLIVEHDEEIMRTADLLIDIGPEAGQHGGEVVFQGPASQLSTATNSLTADYLLQRKQIPIPAQRRKWNSFIEIKNAHAHNLKNISVKFPLRAFTVVTGVSGSGKSTLIHDLLYDALNSYIKKLPAEEASGYDELLGDLHLLYNVQFVDQNPIGRSTRSNPVTYCKAYDEIRKLFAEQPAAVYNSLRPQHFSFNTDGGRCEECQGEGTITVEMQFMADVKLVCEACHGQRFKDEVLEVRFMDKNINDILEMTVDQAITFFASAQKNAAAQRIVSKLEPLSEVGLGYIKLGQPTSTLSGGETQRLKLSSFIASSSEPSTLFIFDEPTTGLHFHDIQKLLRAFNLLIENGHSVIVIEHNLDVIKSADYIIDLGPEGGEQGGELIFSGTPEELLNHPKSYTAQALKSHIAPK